MTTDTTERPSATPYAVARAMLILEGRNSASRIARELNTYREHVSHTLNRMRQDGLADRRVRVTTGGGYEWWLTQKGQAFAIYTRPDDADRRPVALRYSHRALSMAMGIPRAVEPPAGRLHLLR